MQLFTVGLITSNDGDVVNEIDEYGIDPDDLEPLANDDYSSVELPETYLPLSDALRTTINPEANSTNQGIDIYMQTVSQMHTLMQNECRDKHVYCMHH